MKDQLQTTNYKLQTNKGFTLIELLVVIAIIGILSSIVLVSLGTARTKARDARRQSDVRQINLAMELCYDDLTCGAVGVNDYLATPTPAGPPSPPGIAGSSSYLNPAPTGAGAGVAYFWFSNAAAITAPAGLAAQQWYCMYATSEAVTGTYYVASNFGVFTKNTIPAHSLGVLTNCN